MSGGGRIEGLPDEAWTSLSWNKLNFIKSDRGKEWRTCFIEDLGDVDHENGLHLP